MGAVTRLALRAAPRSWGAPVAVFLAGSLAAALIGCSDDGPAAPPPEPDMRGLVTAEVAATIDGTGHFVLRYPPPPPLGPRERPRQDLLALAAAFGPWAARGIGFERIAEMRGAPIDLAALRPCGRAVYIATPFALPDGAPTWVHRSLGPQWIFPLCESATAPPAVTLIVAANTTTQLIDGWPIDPPDSSGAPYMPIGVRLGESAPWMSAERAAAAVYRATGARIARVPEAAGTTDYVTEEATCYYWKLTVDRPVRVRGLASGTVSEVTDFFVFVVRCMLVPEPPSGVLVATPTQPAFIRQLTAVHPPVDTLEIPVLRPLLFEPFEIVP